MYLDWLELGEFRSYSKLSFRPDSGVNVLVGDNGSGKTSVLEAIGYLASLKSFRRAPDASVVNSDAETAIVRGEFSSEETSATVEIELPRAGRRRVLMNGKRIASRRALAEHIALVAFLPDDLDLVKRGPAYRRDFFDDLAAQVWPVAGSEQQEYERALRQRNGLLRRDGRRADRTTLDVLDERLADLGSVVLRRRMDAVDVAAPVVTRLYSELGERPEAISWEYTAAGLAKGADGRREQLRTELLEALQQTRETDLDRRVTTVGPQRDDVSVSVGGRDVRTRASQGEQRSVALGLRLASFEVLADRRGSAPILLLDDVFSELDPGRGHRLMQRLPSGQVFVTTARSEEVPLAGTRWRVGAGDVKPSD